LGLLNMTWLYAAFAGSDWVPIVVAGATACFVAVCGALLTDIGPWYRQLRKPSWQPPDWAFGPAWTLIFTLTAWAGVLAWNRAPDDAMRVVVVSAFGLNGLLNILWSLLFFKWRRPDWALIEVAALWLSIVALIVLLAALAPLGAWLLTAYLAWVSFAAFLNWTVVRLNRPFPLRLTAGAGVG
jgi:tryptophan-rich sensory protein